MDRTCKCATPHKSISSFSAFLLSLLNFVTENEISVRNVNFRGTVVDN